MGRFSIKNYEMTHLIQSAGLPEDAQRVVVCEFNKPFDAKEPDGCMSTSISLYHVLDYFGYILRLIIGTAWVNNF